MEYLKIEMTQNNLKAHFWWKLAELANPKQLPGFFSFSFFKIIFIYFLDMKPLGLMPAQMPAHFLWLLFCL